MKLAQIRDSSGALSAAIVAAGGYRPIPEHTVASLIRKAEEQGRSLGEVASEMTVTETVNAHPALPVTPSEVWGCGCTYAPSAEFRDGELGTGEGMYGYVHNPSHRPEIFFKGTSRYCVGPGEAIGIRADSKFTAPEPELAIVINSRGDIVGYTLGNDVSAWDIEKENALYLPQSKAYEACCSLGPVLVTPEEIANPYDLELSCTITRNGRTTFEGSASTALLRRKFEELAEYLLRSNPVPAPAVIFTGTGIIVTEEAALQPGDVVTIEAAEIGKLVNPAKLV